MSNLLSLTDTTWTGVNTVFAIVFRISFLLLVFDDISDWLFFCFLQISVFSIVSFIQPHFSPSHIL